MGVLNAERLDELRKATVSDRGNRLDVAIRLSKLTQSHIARSLHITPMVLSSVKLGKRRTLSLDLAQRIAEYFGCGPTDLFPPEHIVLEMASLPDLPRPFVQARSPRAGTKRLRRGPRKSQQFVYPLPAHLEKQRLSLFEMLTDARLSNSLTLQEVADRLDRTRQQVEQWESAFRSLRIDSFMEWADALGYRLCLEPVSSVVQTDIPNASDQEQTGS